MVKLIIFDFDGVISDNCELHYRMSRLQFRSLTREEHKKLFDGNLHVEREKLKDRNKGYDVKLHFNEARKYMEVDPFVKSELEEFSKNYRLGIISSGMEESILEFLDRNNMKGLFSFVYGVETDVSKVKKFEKAFEEYGIQNNECVFVTDTVGDVVEASKVNTRCIGVDFGYHERQRLEGAGVENIVSNFGDIRKVVSRLNQVY